MAHSVLTTIGALSVSMRITLIETVPARVEISLLKVIKETFSL